MKTKRKKSKKVKRETPKKTILDPCIHTFDLKECGECELYNFCRNEFHSLVVLEGVERKLKFMWYWLCFVIVAFTIIEVFNI